MAGLANVQDGTVSVVDLWERKVVWTLEVDAARRADKRVHVGAHGMAFLP